MKLLLKELLLVDYLFTIKQNTIDHHLAHLGFKYSYKLGIDTLVKW